MNTFPKPGETYKAHDRRTNTGWFDQYIVHPGLDIGPDRDPLNHTFRRWLYEVDGDATHMAGVPDQIFNTIYASHILEHLHDPQTGLRNWWRILRPGGHLIVLVPHRDLYEKRTRLPSKWNGDHKHFFLPDKDDPPHTMSFARLLAESIPDGRVVSYQILQDGFVDPGPDRHSHGEYSIEAIIQRPSHS